MSSHVPATYLRLVLAGYRRHATYRAAALAGLFTNTVFGVLRVSILLAVVAAAGGAVAGYDAASTSTFVWLGQGLLAVVQLWGDGELATRVRTGDVAIDLSRPWDLQAAVLATDVGRAAHAVLWRFLPPIAFGALVTPFRWPAHLVTYPLFAASVVLAVLLSAATRFLLDLGSFWLLDARGLRGLYVAVSGLAAGLTVPLAYFPTAVRDVLYATPFPGMLQTPIDVFVERGNPAGPLALQVLLLAVMLGWGRFALVRATRKLVIQGG